jgi:hypothetical protein
VLVLHLSDVHLTPPNTDLNLIWNGVTGVLDGEKLTSFDFVVVSGDLSQAAARGEYDLLEVFAATHLMPLVGGVRRRIVFVPGNHDVSWNHDVASPVQITREFNLGSGHAELERVVRSLKASPQGCGYRMAVSRYGHAELLKLADPAMYARRFEEVQGFLARFYEGQLSDAPNKPFNLLADPELGDDWSAHVFPDSNVAFFGFNSCHLNDAYWHGAHLNPSAVAKANQHRRQLKADYPEMEMVAVWHHGFVSERGRPDRLTLEDVGQLLSAGFRVGFHGHTHLADEKVVDLLRHRFAVISTGSLGAGKKERPGAVGNQFSVVRILPNQVQVQRFSSAEHHRMYESSPVSRFPLSQVAESRPDVPLNRVSEHERVWTVGDNGVAHVAVSLYEVHTSSPLPLAVLSPPFCNAISEKASLESGMVDVERRALPDGRVRYSLSRAGTYNRVAWEYVVSNCIALTKAELSILPNRATIFPNLPGGRELRSHTVRFETGNLKLRISLPKGCPIADARPVVERQLEVDQEEHWERQPAEEKRCSVTLELNGTEASLVVQNPTIGLRYGISFVPVREGDEIPAGARMIASRILDCCRKQVGSFEQKSGLSGIFTGMFMKLLRQVPELGVKESDGPLLLDGKDSWCAFLWNSDHRQLQPVFGQFAPRSWARSFHAGNGVAGHAFRFSDEAGWLEGGDGTRASCIFERPSPTSSKYDWILSLPLLVGREGPSIGVVSFGGTDSAHPAGRALRDLVNEMQRTGGRKEASSSEQYKLLDNLGSAVNTAFWGLVKDEGQLTAKWFTPYDRTCAEKILDNLLKPESSA